MVVVLVLVLVCMYYQTQFLPYRGYDRCEWIGRTGTPLVEPVTTKLATTTKDPFSVFWNFFPLLPKMHSIHTSHFSSLFNFIRIIIATSMEEISDSSDVKPQRYSNNAENEKSRNKWKPIMTKQMRKNDTITIIGSKTRTTCSNNRSRLLKRRKAKPIKIAICSSSNSSSLPPSPPHPSPPPSSASTLNPTCDYQQCHQYRHCTNLRPMQQKTNTSSVEASRFQPSFKTISRKWNRLGLVRRTHSPINMVSFVTND